jgi:hypothetical protein
MAAAFGADIVGSLVHWAQSSPPDYSYKIFSIRAKAAVCAGYHVSFPGRRIVYVVWTAGTQTELFPI